MKLAILKDSYTSTSSEKMAKYSADDYFLCVG